MSQTKRLSQLNAAESWLNNYRDLVNADFKAYDFESLREALLDHIQVNYGEDFNDFINSSEYVALVDLISFPGLFFLPLISFFLLIHHLLQT